MAADDVLSDLAALLGANRSVPVSFNVPRNTPTVAVAPPVAPPRPSGGLLSDLAALLLHGTAPGHDALAEACGAVQAFLAAVPRSLRRPSGLLWQHDGDEPCLAQRTADTASVAQAWSAYQEHHGTTLVALVGMVSAGKSSLGNWLLGLGASEVFQEGPMLETKQAQEAVLEEGVELVDLPGLGSVLAEADDRTARERVRRANVILLTIGVDGPITRHLYEFLQHEVSHDREDQRLVVALTKTDVWDTLPPAVAQRRLDEYRRFLLEGDSRLGFAGLRALFHYEVPVVAVSVQRARDGRGDAGAAELKAAFRASLAEVGVSHRRLLSRELARCLAGWKHLPTLLELTRVRAKKVERAVERVSEQLSAIAEAQLTSFEQQLVAWDRLCWSEMQAVPGATALQRWFSNGSASANAQLHQIRSRFEQLALAALEPHRGRLQDDFRQTVAAALGDTPKLHVPPASADLRSAVERVFYANWDLQDDGKRLGKSVTQEQVNSRTRECLTRVCATHRAWADLASHARQVQEFVQQRFGWVSEQVASLSRCVEHWQRAQHLVSSVSAET